ncbi:exopolysaccharide biosynthesis polyprenyl glycosylphosphotransferase [Leptospira vanthielii]|uniref:Exopolysaccharide biosynthesis polyprenyl glycosylphosphotransferase n=1 Tax=Leptospira vanthielii TaxID=293085 RepID=A0ABY2NTR7_9LEPT|nr:exopolysaccharide biosynthesis polyprenyl glycosylphosphotransferase [Leptospira vanthielii]TGM60656.1 exopolysaccharide biosynthesis polyprenyl glycosylphosphotransferase [Leptospira vanthielii]
MIFNKKQIERIPIFLITLDIISIILCTRLFEIYFSVTYSSAEHFWIRYLVFLLFPFVQLVLNTYKPTSSDLRLSFIERYLLGYTLYLIIVSSFLFLSEFRYLGNAWGRGIFFSNTFSFFFVGLINRYIIKIYKNTVVDKKQINLLLIASPHNISNLFAELETFKSEISYYIYSDSNAVFQVPGIKYIKHERDLVTVIKNFHPAALNFIVIDNGFEISPESYSQLVEASVKGVNVLDLSNFVELYVEKFPVLFTSLNWIITSGGFSYFNKPIQERIKRIIDYSLCLLLVPPSLILIIFSAIVIKLSSPGSVFFSQLRIGRGGKEFLLYKLRTMKIEKENQQAKWASANDPRITWFGNFLRKTRIDELPQIFNVLKGDMSFIGPRPEQPAFVNLLSQEIPFYSLRHSVSPGLTGWAQVNFGYGSSVNDSRIKLEYDLFYIKNFSLLLDFRIIIKTMRVVLFGRGR